MAAFMAKPIRALCKNVYVLTRLKRNCDTCLPPCQFERSVASISGPSLVENNTHQQAPSRALTSRGSQTDPKEQDNKEVRQAPSPDHPLPNIEDPFKEPVQPCILCRSKVPLSYKNVQLLSQFVSPNTGRMYGRYITKLCRYQQREVTKAIKRARQMGFMPYMYRETIFLKDPNLFDIRYSGNMDIAMKEPSNLVEPQTLEETEEEIPDK